MLQRPTERPLTVECEEVAQISAALPSWRIESIPLFPAAQEHGCVSVSSDDGQLATLRFARGVLLRGSSPRSRITLLLNDPNYPSVRIQSRPLKAGIGLMLGPLAHMDVFVPASGTLMFVSTSASGFDLASAPGPGSREFRSVPESLHLQAIEASRHLMQQSADVIAAAPGTRKQPRDLGKSLLREAARMPNDTTDQPIRHVAAARACNYIDSHLGDSISLQQLCEVAGARPRTLEYGFREFYDVGPMTYLRCMRLYRTRRELLSAKAVNASVTATARRWHFSHMGQFSRDYRLLFGENPSTTLARALSIRAAAAT